MKVGSIADLHWHQPKPSSKVVDGVYSRIFDTASAVLQYTDYLKSQGIIYSLFSGDWYTSRRAVDSATREISNMTLDEIGSKIMWVGIQGNHDFYDTEGSYSSLAGLHKRFILLNEENPAVILCQEWDGIMDAVMVQGIRWYEKPEDFNDTEIIKPSEYHKLPFYVNGKKIKLSKEDKKTYSEITRICLIHQDIIGCVYPTGREVKRGVDVSRLEASFDVVLAGHIHKFQELSDKTVMVGSLIQHDFGDAGQERGFLVVDSDDMLWERHKVKSPRFIDIEDISDIDKDSKDFYRIKGQDIEIDVDRLPENVSIIRERRFRKESEVDIDASFSAVEAMNKYVKEIGERFDFNKDKLNSIMEELVTEALSE